MELSSKIPQQEPKSNKFPDDYLKSRIWHLLAKSRHAKKEKERNEVLIEEVRPLVRRLRNGGFFDYFAAFSGMAILIIAAVLIRQNWPKIYFYSYPNDYLRVVQNVNLEKGDFVMQRVLNGVPQPETEMHFRGLVPRFEAGHTLAWIRYRDAGSYQSIEGFDVLREDKVTFVNGQWQRMPILPKNCPPNWAINHLACEGGKARFE